MSGMTEACTALQAKTSHGPLSLPSDGRMSEMYHASPLTPRGPRRAAAILDDETLYIASAQEEVMNTPRKKIGKERPGRSTVSRASSSPMRCSPRKRYLHVSSSSSSPSREPTARERSRPARRRSRTSSVTTDLVQGLASVRCQEECASDGAMIMTDETLSPMIYERPELKTVKEKDGNSMFGSSAIQAMKVGFSKYSPLLKVLSEPWRGENGKTDRAAAVPDTPIKGHRRSAAWGDKILPGNQGNEDATLGVPFADREKASLYLDSLVSKSHAKAEISRGSRPRRERSAQNSTHQGGGLEYLSPRRASLPRRATRKPWSPLDVVAYASKATAQATSQAQKSPASAPFSQDVSAERESDVMNRQTSLSQEAWQSILKGDINSPPSEETIVIPSSSMPSIFVTPPASNDATQTQSVIPLLNFKDSAALTIVDHQQKEDIDMATPDADKTNEMATERKKRGVNDASRIEAACILRQCEDEQGLALYKATIDKLLSEYFVYRSAKRTLKLARQITDFLQEVIKLKEDMPEVDNSKYAPYRHRELPIISIPSISTGRCHKIDKSGDTVLLPTMRVSQSYQSALNIVLEHLVTGLIALVTDNRAPYETPQALGRLCLGLQRELPLAISASRSSRKEKDSGGCVSPASPITSWVQACATSTSNSADDIACRTAQIGEEEQEEYRWIEFLRSTSPSAIFVHHINTTVNGILERGEDIRSKANLLAVPPPRKGSRKRWMMATAEITQRRLARDKAMNDVTRGIISENDYRRLERQWAVTGNPKDSFAGLTLVRFIGELYVSGLLDVHAIRRWLFRFFINTVFPNVPSSYELEAGCALLITVGEALDHEAGILTRYIDDSSPLSSPEQATHIGRQTESGDDMDIVKSATQVEDLYVDDWTYIKAKSPQELLKKTESRIVTPNGDIDREGETSAPQTKKEVALDTITSIMKRLEGIIALEEIDNESRAWTREIIALRERHWQQGHCQESSRQPSRH